MQRTPVVFAFAVHALVLAGCDRPQQVPVNALAADPARLHALRAQCRAGEHDGAFCAQVASSRPAAPSLQQGRAGRVPDAGRPATDPAQLR